MYQKVTLKPDIYHDANFVVALVAPDVITGCCQDVIITSNATSDDKDGIMTILSSQCQLPHPEAIRAELWWFLCWQPQHTFHQKRDCWWNKLSHTSKHTTPETWMSLTTLTHITLDKMAAILQTIFLDAFLWMKSFVFWFKFHWSLFLMVQLTITQHWLR